MNQQKILVNFFERLSQTFDRKLLSQVGFFADQLYVFRRSSDIYSFESAESFQLRPRILVVGREHYHESVKDYPVGDTRDLKKILSANLGPSPYSGQIFYLIERLSEQSHRVTTWVIKTTSIESLVHRPWLLIPETMCILQQRSSPTLIVVSRPGGQVTVSIGESGLASFLSAKNSDLRQSAIIESSTSHFGDLTPQIEMPTSIDVVKIVWRGLVKTLLSNPMSFILPIKRSSAYPWSRAGKLSATIFAAYLLVSSAFLLGADSWVDFRLDQMQEKASESLDIRRELRARSRSMSAMNDITKSMAPTWIVWETFLGLQDSKTSFTAIAYSNGVVTLSGLASRATDVLSQLGENSAVKTAEFKSPVRKRRDREQFVIEVVLNSKVEALSLLPDGDQPQ
ncbi:hypothetical protein N9R68_02005 [Porticoccaceae bacterium]|nr:hypothetical protein [Porticoccaceae bacterium]MDB2383118.1 hypothetical protein [Porticoccaceae bacterium]MDB2669528.1 hypothetical protein [Porticoccaceae bacterium]